MVSKNFSATSVSSVEYIPNEIKIANETLPVGPPQKVHNFNAFGYNVGKTLAFSWFFGVLLKTNRSSEFC